MNKTIQRWLHRFVRFFPTQILSYVISCYLELIRNYIHSSKNIRHHLSRQIH